MLKRQTRMFYKLTRDYRNHTRQKITIYRHYCSTRNPLSKLTLHINGISLESFIQDLIRQYTTKNAATLKPIAMILDNRIAIIEQMEHLDDLLNDKDAEIVKMASEEKATFTHRLKCMEGVLMDAVLNAVSEISKDDHAKGSSSMVLEVSAGIGGQEAMLFASELFAMYIRFIDYKGWGHYVAEEQRTDLGGVRHGSIIIEDANAYQWLQHEAGVHRVQRIPTTEKGGRLHTSTVAVCALPQPTHVQVHIRANDLRIETKRATGAGGQHVNTTDSAVRIVHVPSGLVVECQTDRSQIRNKHIAMERLRSKLYNFQLQEQMAKRENIKSNQVQSNCRNQKIRTYNYNQDRITDHRLQHATIGSFNIYNIKGFMLDSKHLENLIRRLDLNIKYDKLFRAVQEFQSRNK